MEIFTPNTDGVSRFRPIVRPYPAEILQLVPELLPEATMLAATSNALDAPFREQLERAATELCDAKGLVREIVDADRDLANATRQALLMQGVVQPMEWWRHGSDAIDIGAWALTLEVAANWGVNEISILDHERPNPEYTEEQQACVGQQTEGVLRKIFNQLTTGAKTHPGWNQFIKKFGRNRYGASEPQRMCLMQVALCEHNGRTSPQSVLCLYMLNPSTLKSLEAQWAIPATGAGTDAPRDFVNGFACGDLLDPDRGAMIVAYDQNAMQHMYEGGAFGQTFGGVGGGKGGNCTDYVVSLKPGCAAMPDATSQALFKPWDDILWLPTREEAWTKAFEAMGEHATAYAGRYEICLLPATIRNLAQQCANNDMYGGGGGPTLGSAPTSLP
jgi:hypothetical protein